MSLGGLGLVAVGADRDPVAVGSGDLLGAHLDGQVVRPAGRGSGMPASMRIVPMKLFLA